MSKVVDYIIENELLPIPVESWEFNKEWLINYMKSWNGKPFAYYDKNKNKTECNTQQKLTELFEYISRGTVTALNCGFFAARVLGVEDDILVLLVENNEDVFFISNPTAPETIPYKRK